jgi:AbrB family looped-hinge helix DNA binding protein
MAKNLINKNNLTVLTMLESVKLSSRGQLVIPERMRKKLGLAKGAIVIIRDEGTRLVLEKEDTFTRSLDELRLLQEKKGFHMLAEEQLKKIWDNKQDDIEWQRYM